VHQYRVAGLRLDEELPSKTYTAFPHSDTEGGFTTAAEDTDAYKSGDDLQHEPIKGRPKDSHLKLRHLGVLTAVLQKCLMDRDWERAERAWALLIRAQVGGKGMELRTSGYWGVGGEILVQRAKQRSRQQSQEGSQSQSQRRDGGDVDVTVKKGQEKWTNRQGIERLKEYYERLILQFPYKRQWASSVNALDFWPPMLSAEIYGLWDEYETSLEHINNPLAETEDSRQMSESGSEYDDEQENWTGRRPPANKTERKNEALRIRTLRFVERVAERMDSLMTSLPFMDSMPLHRLRGMLALWMADLNISSGKAEHREAAVRHFEMVRKKGGVVPEWIMQEDEPDEDRSEEVQDAGGEDEDEERSEEAVDKDEDEDPTNVKYDPGAVYSDDDYTYQHDYGNVKQDVRADENLPGSQYSSHREKLFDVSQRSRSRESDEDSLGLGGIMADLRDDPYRQQMAQYHDDFSE
jgi:hypothetical protein